MALAPGCLTKHGFPRGYRFVPGGLELISLLADRLRGRPFPPPLGAIFHNVHVLSHHPAELYEAFKEHAENGYIYFFSRRVFPAWAREHGDSDNDKNVRPVRAATGGNWKPSGGGKELTWPRKMGGAVAGRMVTMVFYARGNIKTRWGMHEVLLCVKPGKDKHHHKYANLALYRLYIVKNKNNGKEGEEDAAQCSSEEQASVSDHRGATVSGELEASTSMAPWPVQPGGMAFTTNQALASASTSQMAQQPSVEHDQGAQPMEEAVPPPPEEVVPAAEDEPVADPCNDNWLGMPDLDLGFDDSFLFEGPTFTLEELMGGSMFEEQPVTPTPTPMEGDNPSGGDENSQAGGK